MISLIVHGGAWDIPDGEVEAHRKGCSDALRIGWKILQSGGSAMDAVEQAIRSLEDNEIFDAGHGSHLNAIGQVELDASIMDGTTFRCGAVAGVHHIYNPISLARKVLENSEHILLVGQGAERFASEYGVPLCNPHDLVTSREENRWKNARHQPNFTTKEAFSHKQSSDTVGAVACDGHGVICAGTSTGGTFNKYPGRVGDSPLIGCGTYADSEIGGCSTTGWGEAMIKVVMAKTVIDLLQVNGDNAQRAAERSIEILKRKADGLGGVIAMNVQGRFGIAFNTPRMARAFINEEMPEPIVAV